MKRILPALSFAILLGGCASPWVKYQEAIRCHLDKKGPECDAKYQEAIEGDSKMAGVHSSYGTHLLSTGRTEEAKAEFKKEQENYPTESAKAILALTNPQAIANQNAAAKDTVQAPPPPAPPPQALDTVPAPTAKAKPATSKKVKNAK